MNKSTNIGVNLGEGVLPSRFDVIEAVREGDVDRVCGYLEAGADVNTSSATTERTLLHVACRQGYPEMVSLLLSHGANASATTLRHLTPLHLAAHEGHFKVSRLLLEAWAPVDVQDRAGNTPLHLASRKGHVDVVRLLLQCGAGRNKVEESGWTALHLAVWKGHTEVARMLLQGGADPKVRDLKDRSTPLHVACSSGHPEVAQLLIKFAADSSAVDANGALPDQVIGANCSYELSPSVIRELSELLVGHRTRRRDKSGSSLECVVNSLRAKVYELEDQLSRAVRDRLDCTAFVKDEGRRKTFSAALKPECPLCQTEAKGAILEPCRHLAACCSCANSLTSCPFCGCSVSGYQHLESRDATGYISHLEEEGRGLRAQLERFGTRVRELVTINGDLKLELRRAKAEVSVLTEEKRVIEERLATALRPPTPPLRQAETKLDLSADTDCGSAPEDIGISRSRGGKKATAAQDSRKFAVAAADAGPPQRNLADNEIDRTGSRSRNPRVVSARRRGGSHGSSTTIDTTATSPAMLGVSPSKTTTNKSAAAPHRWGDRLPKSVMTSSSANSTGSRSRPGTYAGPSFFGGGRENGSVKAVTAKSREHSKHSTPTDGSSTEKRSSSPEGGGGSSRTPRRRRAARPASHRKSENQRTKPPSPAHRAVGGSDEYSEEDSGKSTKSDSRCSPASLQRLTSRHCVWAKGGRDTGIVPRMIPRTTSEQRSFFDKQRPPSSLPRDPTAEKSELNSNRQRVWSSY